MKNITCDIIAFWLLICLLAFIDIQVYRKYEFDFATIVVNLVSIVVLLAVFQPFNLSRK